MEQRQSPEEGTKRGLFAPIVLVLLVLSVTGNVFLYSHQLQLQKQARVDDGTRIIEDGYSLSGLFAGMRDSVEQLAAADSLPERFEAKQQALLLLYDLSTRSSRLIEAADGRAGREPMRTEHRGVVEFFNAFAMPLVELGNHDGPLTEEERAYVASLQPLYDELAAIAGKLDFSPGITDLKAMQAAAGGPWIDVAYELAAAMDTDQPQLFGAPADSAEQTAGGAD